MQFENSIQPPVALSVCLSCGLWQNGWLDRDAVLGDRSDWSSDEPGSWVWGCRSIWCFRFLVTWCAIYRKIYCTQWVDPGRRSVSCVAQSMRTSCFRTTRSRWLSWITFLPIPWSWTVDSWLYAITRSHRIMCRKVCTPFSLDFRFSVHISPGFDFAFQYWARYRLRTASWKWHVLRWVGY